MGFRSTFVTEDSSQAWPQWFIDKYKNIIHFPAHHGPLSTKTEIKIYDDLIFRDIQQTLIECGEDHSFRMVLLHECGGVTLVDITGNSIVYSESRDFKTVDFIEHSYCYSCTTPNASHQGPASAGPDA